MERDCDTFPRHPFLRRTKCRVLTHALDVTRTGMNREENREEKVVGEGLDMDV